MAARIAGEVIGRSVTAAFSVGAAGAVGLIYLDVSDGKEDPLFLSEAAAIMSTGGFLSAAGFALAGKGHSCGIATLAAAFAGACCFAIDATLGHKKRADPFFSSGTIGPTGIPQLSGDFFSDANDD